MEPGAGRRASDWEVEPTVEMRIQEVVADTRHRLMNELTVLAAAQSDAALQATKEHGEVRGEIQAVRSEVAALRRDIEQVLPLRESVAELKHRDDVEDARSDAIDRLRVQQRNLAGLIIAGVPVIAWLVSHYQ